LALSDKDHDQMEITSASETHTARGHAQDRAKVVAGGEEHEARYEADKKGVPTHAVKYAVP